MRHQRHARLGEDYMASSAWSWRSCASSSSSSAWAGAPVCQLTDIETHIELTFAAIRDANRRSGGVQRYAVGASQPVVELLLLERLELGLELVLESADTTNT